MYRISWPTLIAVILATHLCMRACTQAYTYYTQERMQVVLEELRLQRMQTRFIISGPAMRTWYRVGVLKLTASQYARQVARQGEIAVAEGTEDEWFLALATSMYQNADSVLGEDEFYECITTQYIEFYGLDNSDQMESHVVLLSDQYNEWHRDLQIRNLREFDRLQQRGDIQAIQELSDEWKLQTDALREFYLRQAEGWMAMCDGADTP